MSGDLRTPSDFLAAQRRMGIVNAADTVAGTVNVSLGGDLTTTANLPYLISAYPVPRIGDVVAILQVGPDMLVLGAVSEASANPQIGSYLGSGNDPTTNVTLSTVNGVTPVYFAYSPAKFTFTLSAQQRVRIYTSVNIEPASASASHYYMHSAYTPGSSVGTINLLVATATAIPTTSVAAASATYEGTVVLAAGTYTAYPAVATTVGSTSDVITSGYTAVYVVG